MNKIIYSLLIVFFIVHAINRDLLGASSQNTPIAVVEKTILNFGIIYVDPSKDGTISLNTDGNISGNIHSPYGGHVVGEYTLSGIANTPVNISIDSTSHELKNNNSSISISYILNESSLVLDDTGLAVVKVGGILSIPSNINEGSYSGNFTLITSY